ncbi:MAG TPA: glycosyltransferase family 39 protein, partial [Anaerolineae bacterium]|nr:glycosyltransferase family 39 protein [Anaerolineae bacterium]
MSNRLRLAAWAAWLQAHFAWVLVVAGLVLLLTNLGNIYLWQDEAETALLSQRLGQYGLPLAFDGRNLIRQAPLDVQYTADWVWVYHPWLPFLFTALSFALLGPTTFAARLPFALAGLATVLLLYDSVRRHLKDQRLAMLSSSLLLLCVPFLLHARQCKYFAFAAL